MAIVREMTEIPLERDSEHLEVECTYAVITSPDGSKYLQLDTYGSAGRKFKGKKSQSLRLSPTAIEQLKEVLKKRF